MAKRYVFRRRLKVPSVSDAVTLDGKVFQARGAATKNARSPIVVRYEDGVTGALKMREWKMREHIAGVENAGVENTGAITYGKPSE